MIRARKNKKAPAVNPVVRATSGEGSRTNPTQEEIQMSHDNASDVDSAPDVLSEYEQMELDFATLAADRGLVPDSALWKLERRAFYFNAIDSLLEPVELLAGGRPTWADPDCDIVSQYGAHHVVASRAWATRLDLHPGTIMDGYRLSARAEVQLMQQANEVEPFVLMRRKAEQNSGEKPTTVKGSETRFTLSEAAELAHLLLLVIDLARGTSDDSAVA